MEKRIVNKEALLITGLLLLYIISVIVNLGVLELAGEEPRRAMVSIEMFHSGNYIRPTLFGWEYYNKPPVYNWILSFMIWLTGSASEFVLRVPSLVFYLLWAYVHYRVSRQFFPKPVALLSSFFVLTSGDVYFYGLANGAEIDIFYSLVVYLQAISLFWFYTKKQYVRLYLFSYFFCAVGLLTKGFPSLVFQGLTLAALCVYARSVKPLFRWQHLTGILLFVSLIGFYFFRFSLYSSPTRLFVNLLNESLMKSAIGERAHKLIDKSIGYPVLILKLLAPWSLLLLLLFKKIKYDLWQNPLARFSILFILFNLWVYWLTGQPKTRYIYMFVPFACTLLVHIYYRFTQHYPEQIGSILRYGVSLFGLSLIGVILLPLFVEVPLTWVVCLAVALGVFLFFYFRPSANRIWYFITGIILLRLVYATLFIPLQYKGIENYSEHLSKAVQASDKTPFQYWSNAVPMSVGVTTKLFEYQLEVLQIPPFIFSQIPYYYYRNTGHILQYDSIPHTTNFLSTVSQVQGKKIDTQYAYFDNSLRERMVFYKLKK